MWDASSWHSMAWDSTVTAAKRVVGLSRFLSALLFFSVLPACSDGGGITVSPGVVNVRFVTQPTDVRIGEPFTVSVELVTAAGQRVTDATNTVSLQLGSGGSLSGTTSRAATSGLATFDGVSVPTAGNGLQITATSGSFSASSASFNVLDPCLTSGASPINPGQTQGTALSQYACRLADGNFADIWRLELNARRSLRIDLTSSQFDALLVLVDPDINVITEDDDGGEGVNSRILWTLEAGTFFIVATSFSAGETGDYQLAVQDVDPCLTFVGSLPVGQTVSGNLRQGTCLNAGAFWTDRWRLDLAESGPVRIDLQSSQFDAFLSLRDAEGNLLAQDDDGGSGTDSRILQTLTAGTYVIEASTFDPGETGSYTLMVAR